MRYKSILLFGAPGSGKGTQGKIIGSIPGFFHSSTGDIFRSLDLRSEVGRTVWEYSTRGMLAPDDLTIQIWQNYIRGMELINRFHPETEIIVLDGLPRNVPQVQLLKGVIDVVAVIYLRAEKSKMIERLRRRAFREGRPDDASDEVIERRMQVFERETRPAIDEYPQDLIYRVDATMSQIRVLNEIVKILVPLKETMDGAEDESDEPAVPAGAAAVAGTKA